MSSITQYVVRYSPKQAEIVADLLERIQSNKLPPGAELPSLVDMSKQYNASTTTIQRSIVHLRERGYIETKSHGSTVAENPPHLSHFGLVVPSYSYQSQYVVALEKEAEYLSDSTSADGMKRRFSVYYDFDYPDDSVRKHTSLMTAVEENVFGGLIFAVLTKSAYEIVKHKSNIPCASLFMASVPGFKNIRQVELVSRSLDILKERHRRRVAFITGSRDAGRDVATFIARTQQRGMTAYPRWIHGIDPAGMAWAETCAQLLMNDREPPDALIIGDDNLVPSATAGIAASGVNVPDDLMIVAHANFPYPTRCEVPAIRIGTDIRRQLKTAVENIEAMRRGKDAPDEIVMQPCLEDEAMS